jgi:hypothetical protein
MNMKVNSVDKMKYRKECSGHMEEEEEEEEEEEGEEEEKQKQTGQEENKQ